MMLVGAAGSSDVLTCGEKELRREEENHSKAEGGEPAKGQTDLQEEEGEEDGGVEGGGDGGGGGGGWRIWSRRCSGRRWEEEEKPCQNQELL